MTKKPLFDETKCYVCQETDGAFIPICDYHFHHPDQTDSMNCEACATCMDCRRKGQK